MFFSFYKRERKGKRVPLGSETAPGSSAGLLRGFYEKGKENIDKKGGGEQRRGRLFFQDRKSEETHWWLFCHQLYQVFAIV